MHGSIGLVDGTLDRMGERRHQAAGRARVARDSLDVAGVSAQEAEQAALAEAALQRCERALEIAAVSLQPSEASQSTPTG